jgi:hypothetical protein
VITRFGIGSFIVAEVVVAAAAAAVIIAVPHSVAESGQRTAAAPAPTLASPAPR